MEFVLGFLGFIALIMLPIIGFIYFGFFGGLLSIAFTGGVIYLVYHFVKKRIQKPAMKVIGH